MQNTFEYEELGRQRQKQLLAEAEQRRLARAARPKRDPENENSPQPAKAARGRRGLGGWLLTLARNRAV